MASSSLGLHQTQPSKLKYCSCLLLQELLTEIEKEIAEAQEEIAACKIELQQAKQIRKNRQEYDALARVIETHPDRKKSQAETDELKKQIADLEETKNKLSRKLDMRAKQLHALIHSVHVLQQILEEDEESLPIGTATTDNNMDTS